MGASNELAPWASNIKVRKGKLSVTLRRGLDANGVVTLLKTQDVSAIRALRVPGSVGLSGLRALVGTTRMRALRSLAISAFADADDAVDVVFESEAMSHLRVLKVWGVSDAIDTRLARGDFVDALQQLEIRNSPELTSLDRYFASARVKTLRFLTVNGTGLNDASTLFDNEGVTSIRSLSLAKCAFDADTVDSLASSNNLGHLKKLNLSYNQAEEVIPAIHRMLRSNHLGNLETLVLCGCELEGFDWMRVAFPNLKRLDLRDNPLEVDEIGEILESGGLPKLKELIVNSPEGALPTRLDRRVLIDDRRPPWA